MSIIYEIQIAMEVWACIVGVIVVMFLGRIVTQHGTIKELWLEMIYTNFLLIFDVCTYVFRDAQTKDALFCLCISYYLITFLHSFINWRYSVNVNNMIHSGSRIKWNGYTIVTTIALSLCLLGLCTNPWTKIYFYFNAVGEYMRGPWIMFSFLMPLFSMFVCGLNIALHYKGFPKRIGRTFVVSMFIIIACIVVQFFMRGYAMINLAINMDILLLLIQTSMNKQEKRMRKLEATCGYYGEETSEEQE